MLRKGSLKIARLAGIDVFVHWTFSFLIAYIVFVALVEGDGGWLSVVFNVVLVGSLFGCVTLHELGHALAARRYGIDTRDITLLPIGGVAQLESIPENPKHELVVAIAGPAVNVVIALCIAVLGSVIFGVDFLASIPEFLQYMFNPDAIEATTDPSTAEEPSELVALLGTFLMALMVVNIVLVVFNAIPAFPMDGGRVFRALLAMRMDRATATDYAARLGQGLAVCFVIYGIFYNPVLALVGMFVYFGAMSENRMVSNQSALKGFTVAHAMSRRFTPLSPHTNLDAVKQEFMNGAEEHFVVLDEATKQVVGVLDRNQLMQAFANKTSSFAPIPIQEFIRKNPPVFRSETPLQAAYEQLQKMGCPMGIVSKPSINGVSIATPSSPIMRPTVVTGVLYLDKIKVFIALQKMTKQQQKMKKGK